MKTINKIYDIMNASDHREDWPRTNYYIDTYQRGYRWGIRHINSLLNDIYINYKKYHKFLSEEEISGYEYCVQPLVLELKSEQNNTKTYSVIDGQQRLTTFSLIFQTLNSLDKNIGIEQKKDQISIEYSRDNTKEILDSISERCSRINEIDIKDLGHNELASIFDTDSELDVALKSKANEIMTIIDEACVDANIDGRFIVNAYVYLYLYFKIIIKQEVGVDSYFSFLEQEKNPAKDYSDERLRKLKNLYKYYTTIIWYEPLANPCTNKSAEDIFEDFNSRKIPLTKSELVKALFMNPDNYIKEGMQDYNGEAIKTKQIMIGIKWDEIERELHNEEMWHFYPHFDVWHSQTRFDAVIDWFVYCECRRIGDTPIVKIRNEYETESLYPFWKIEQWIKDDLAKTTMSSEKANVMKKWWERICAAYNEYAVFFQANRNLTKMFHRISLIQWMEKEYFNTITNGSKAEEYFNRMETCRRLFEKMQGVANDKKIYELNTTIINIIERCFNNEKTASVFDIRGIKVDRSKCDNLEKKIKALAFGPGRILIETFLMIFSLQVLEKNEGATSRFSFYSYFLHEETKNKSDWILEHIFARGTTLEDYESKEPEKQKTLIQTIIDSKWEEYIDYKFKDILSDEDIEKIRDRKKYLVGLMKQLVATDIKPEIYNSLPGYEADYVEPIDDNDYNGLLIEFLKDNSMGNMAILSREENSAVKCSDYVKKKKIIIDKINMGKFVPMATINMFTGTYCDGEFSTEIWYPCHRKKYLNEMIKAIYEYLGVEMEDNKDVK